MTHKNYTKEQQEYIDEIKKGLPEEYLLRVGGYRSNNQYADYFSNNAVEGIDYIECPFTGHRVGSLSRHLLTIPNIDIDKVYMLFPYIKDTASNKVKKFSDSQLKPMLDSNGNIMLDSNGSIITVTQYVSEQATKTRKTVGEDGMTIDERSAQKRLDKMSNDINEYGMNGSIQQQLNIHYNKTARSVGKRKTDFENYKESQNYVTYYSSLYTEKKEIGKIKRIVSIREGFDNNISPILILRLENIVYNDYIHNKESFDFRLNELLTLTDYTKERSDYEYQLYQDAIQASYDTGDAFSNVYILYHIAKYYDFEDYKEDTLRIIKTIFKR